METITFVVYVLVFAGLVQIDRRLYDIVKALKAMSALLRFGV